MRTIGGASFAWLAFADGTQLQFVGESAMKCASARTGRSRCAILRGQFRPRLRRSRRDRPLLIETDTASMEVVGHGTGRAAEDESTQLNVVSGAVKLRRQADGEEMMVRRRTVCGGFAQGSGARPTTHAGAGGMGS